MTTDLTARISSIIEAVQELGQVCYPGSEFKICYLTIFSQSESDFENIRKEMAIMGVEREANNGYKYQLHEPVTEAGESIEFIRVRQPDIHRKEFGCADLDYSGEDYAALRNIALEKGFDVILRKDYEMIELSDFIINVYAYLVKEL